MKLHHKEWPSVILTRSIAKGKDFHSTVGELLPANLGTWRMWDDDTAVDALYLFRSKNRYFQFSGPDEKLSSYFEDVIHPRVTSRAQIEYPVYCIERQVNRVGIIILSAPYAGLLTELINKAIRPRLSEELAFIRPMILRIYEIARQVVEQEPPTTTEAALSPNRTSVILRGGRITLTVNDQESGDTSKNASIKSLALMGTNILRSELFARLVDEGIYGLKFSLDPSLLKVAYKRGNALGVIVKMDQYGNFHFRPGFGGKNLEGIVDLIGHCQAGKALDTSYSIPVARASESDL